MPLAVRGVLVVLLDAAVLAALWFLAEAVSGTQAPRPRWRSLSRSFRIRLAATLGAFFILPAVGFAAWSFTRLAEEVERSRDLLITQTLRDAAITAGGSLRADVTGVGERLQELSRRIDADLALYQGGRLAGTSTQVLEDLGIMPQLMDPIAFNALALEGELEVTRDGSIPRLRERVGYRVVQPGYPSSLGVLATPQLAEDASLAVRRLDLALVLVLVHTRRRGSRAGGGRPRLAGAVATRGRAAPLGDCPRARATRCRPMEEARRSSSSRCSGPSDGWRPTSGRASMRWRRRGTGPRRCSRRSQPASSASIRSAGC